jgi:hypothetical protein
MSQSQQGRDADVDKTADAGVGCSPCADLIDSLRARYKSS